MGKKGFVFTLEAAITLLIASLLIAGLQYQHLSTYSHLYLYQLANDFQQLAAKKYPAEIARFSRGDPDSMRLLEGDFSALMEQLGNYCLTMEAGGNRLPVNCGDGNYRNKFPTSRLFFDGQTLFELKIAVSAQTGGR